MPAGHLLMLSPYWSHRDQRSFTDPHLFKPVSFYLCASELVQMYCLIRNKLLFDPGESGFTVSRHSMHVTCSQ